MAKTTCNYPGCTEPRHVTSGGTRLKFCTEHMREYWSEQAAKQRRAKGATVRPNKRRDSAKFQLPSYVRIVARTCEKCRRRHLPNTMFDTSKDTPTKPYRICRTCEQIKSPPARKQRNTASLNFVPPAMPDRVVVVAGSQITRIDDGKINKTFSLHGLTDEARHHFEQSGYTIYDYNANEQAEDCPRHRCSKCGEPWPETDEFYFFRDGRPAMPCKACQAESRLHLLDEPCSVPGCTEKRYTTASTFCRVHAREHRKKQQQAVCVGSEVEADAET